jgi:hypothetical protein
MSGGMISTLRRGQRIASQPWAMPVLLLVFLVVLLAPTQVFAQQISRLIIDVRTQDVAFAGTDNDIHLQIGGRDFYLDVPNRDDFERGHTDRFEFDLSSEPLSIELIRGIGQISVTKIQDSFFGGGWDFGGLTIWGDSTATDPLYSNSSINVSLDGDDLEWTTMLGDPGWNVPEPPAFSACSTGIILARPNVAHRANAADPTTIDSDCDGIPDASDPTFDQPVDSDGDGLPDLDETQTGTNPNDPDTDHDEWADGRNRRKLSGADAYPLPRRTGGYRQRRTLSDSGRRALSRVL